jgi:hypothetical protein
MQILIARRMFGHGLCKTCKKSFGKRAPNQIHCDEHSFWKRYQGGRILMKLYAVEKSLKQAADESGNPKVWRAGECSQEFLRSLIPNDR